MARRGDRFGWVYMDSTLPPPMCSCGLLYVRRNGVIACPHCDVTDLWPRKR